MIKHIRSLSWILLAVVFPCALGCASAYHDYQDCRVPCQYCPPAPLPYATYTTCVCHSAPAAEYSVTE